MKTFGNRAKTLLNKSSYDVVIDNQSLSYGMIEVQKNLPLIEVIHHPITKDYRYDIQFSKGIIQKLSKWRWFSFLKMQKKVSIELKVISTPSHNSKKDIVKDFGVLEKNISVTEFYNADQVFTTGTMGELAQVIEIDKRQINNNGRLLNTINSYFKVLTETTGEKII